MISRERKKEREREREREEREDKKNTMSAIITVMILSRIALMCLHPRT